MTDTAFLDIKEFTRCGKCFIPLTQDLIDHFNDLVGKNLIESEYCLIPQNENAITLCENTTEGQVIDFEEIKARDLNFHKCYMSLLNYIWDFLPDNFKAAIPVSKFYLFLKHLRGLYNVVYKFKDEIKKAEISDYLKANKKQFRLTYKSIEKIADKFGRSELIEYKSISFGRMSQTSFEEYVKEQMPFVYDSVLGAFYKDEKLANIIATIEHDYRKFLNKL
jgi:hypothetical protein